MYYSVHQYLRIDSDIIIQFESPYSSNNDSILNSNIGKENLYAYWYFLADFLDKTCRYLSKKTLGGKCGY